MFDLQTLATVSTFLASRGRPVTLDEALADVTLAAFDQDQLRTQAAPTSRARRRGALRRLQAVHHDVPWRKPRTPEGDRVHRLIGPEAMVTIRALMKLAAESETAGADAVIAAVKAVDGLPPRAHEAAGVDTPVWERAKRFAMRHGIRLTRDLLTAAVVHRLLREDEPLAVTVARYDLSYRYLDLGLTHASGSEDVLTSHETRLLRGA